MPGYHPRYLLLRLANGSRQLNPAERADHATSMADARTALCLANGVAACDIDPGTGYDISERAYQSVRRSWVSYIKEHGWTGEYRPENELPQVFADWVRRRPDLTVGDSLDAWLKDGEASHRQRWEGSGLSCTRPDCSLHLDGPEPTA